MILQMWKPWPLADKRLSLSHIAAVNEPGPPHRQPGLVSCLESERWGIRGYVHIGSHVMLECSGGTSVACGVKSKCTALLNWKHRRFGRIQVLASARALHLTTYYHMPKYFV